MRDDWWGGHLARSVVWPVCTCPCQSCFPFGFHLENHWSHLGLCKRLIVHLQSTDSGLFSDLRQGNLGDNKRTS
jgi:hypothetical protein